MSNPLVFPPKSRRASLRVARKVSGGNPLACPGSAAPRRFAGRRPSNVRSLDENSGPMNSQKKGNDTARDGREEDEDENLLVPKTSNINVAVRFRPLNELESALEENAWELNQENKSILDLRRNSEFYFDHIFSEDDDNISVFSHVAKDIVDGCIRGFNGTIFAYGQTSSGKTHTMMGNKDHNVQGIIPMAVQEIFDMIEHVYQREFVVTLSYLEVYNERLIDLLGETETQELSIAERANGEIEIRGIKTKRMSKPEDVFHVLDTGEKLRHTGSTALNDRSSRSHTILRIKIESQLTQDSSPSPEIGDNLAGKKRKLRDRSSSKTMRVGMLNLVDLAGSEAVSRAQTEGERKREGGNINKSLLALSKVISQLCANQSANDDKKRMHVNFRDSKLTRLLSSSLGGNSRTAVICNCSHASENYRETVSTLEFAVRVKSIRNKISLNLFSTEDQSEMKVLKQQKSQLEKRIEELGGVQTENAQLKAEKAKLEGELAELSQQIHTSNQTPLRKFAKPQTAPLKFFTKRRKTIAGGEDNLLSDRIQISNCISCEKLTGIIQRLRNQIIEGENSQEDNNILNSIPNPLEYGDEKTDEGGDEEKEDQDSESTPRIRIPISVNSDLQEKEEGLVSSEVENVKEKLEVLRLIDQTRSGMFLEDMMMGLFLRDSHLMTSKEDDVRKRILAEVERCESDTLDVKGQLLKEKEDLKRSFDLQVSETKESYESKIENLEIKLRELQHSLTEVEINNLNSLQELRNKQQEELDWKSNEQKKIDRLVRAELETQKMFHRETELRLKQQLDQERETHQLRNKEMDLELFKIIEGNEQTILDLRKSFEFEKKDIILSSEEKLSNSLHEQKVEFDKILESEKFQHENMVLELNESNRKKDDQINELNGMHQDEILQLKRRYIESEKESADSMLKLRVEFEQNIQTAANEHLHEKENLIKLIKEKSDDHKQEISLKNQTFNSHRHQFEEMLFLSESRLTLANEDLKVAFLRLHENNIAKEEQLVIQHQNELDLINLQTALLREDYLECINRLEHSKSILQSSLSITTEELSLLKKSHEEVVVTKDEQIQLKNLEINNMKESIEELTEMLSRETNSMATVVADLNKTILTKGQELALLSSELESLRTSLKDSRDEISQTAIEMTFLQDKVVNLNVENDRLRQDLNNSKDTEFELEAKVKAANEEIMKMIVLSRNQKFEMTKNYLERQIATDQKIQNLRIIVSNKVTEIQNVSVLAAELYGRFLEAKLMIKKNLDKSKCKEEELENEIRKEKEAAYDTKMELQYTEDKLQELNCELEEVKKQQSEENKRLQSLLDDYTYELNKVNALLNEAQDQKKIVINENQNIKSEFENLEQGLKEIEVLRSSEEYLKSTIAQLNKENGLNVDELAKLKISIEEQVDEARSLKQRLKDKDVEIGTLNNEIRMIQGDMISIKEEYSSIDDALCVKKAENERNREEISHLKMELEFITEELQSRTDEALKIISSLEKKNIEIEEALSISERKMKFDKMTLAHTKSELEWMIKINKDLESAIDAQEYIIEGFSLLNEKPLLIESLWDQECLDILVENLHLQEILTISNIEHSNLEDETLQTELLLLDDAVNCRELLFLFVARLLMSAGSIEESQMTELSKTRFELEKAREKYKEHKNEMEKLELALTNERLTVKRLAATVSTTKEEDKIPRLGVTPNSHMNTKELSHLKRKLEELQHEVQEKNREIKKLFEEHKQTTSVLLEERQKNSKNEAELSSLLADIRVERNSLIEETQSLENKLRQTNQQLCQNKREIVDLQNMLHLETVAKEEIKKEIVSLRGNSKQVGNSEETLDVEALIIENGRLRKNLSESQGQLRISHKNIKELASTNRSLSMQVSKVEGSEIPVNKAIGGAFERKVQQAPLTDTSSNDKIRGVMQNIRNLSESLRKPLNKESNNV